MGLFNNRNDEDNTSTPQDDGVVPAQEPVEQTVETPVEDEQATPVEPENEQVEDSEEESEEQVEEDQAEDESQPESRVQTTENLPAEVGGAQPSPVAKVDWQAEYAAYVNGEKTMNDIADEHHVSVLVVRDKIEGLEHGQRAS